MAFGRCPGTIAFRRYLGACECRHADHRSAPCRGVSGHQSQRECSAHAAARPDARDAAPHRPQSHGSSGAGAVDRLRQCRQPHACPRSDQPARGRYPSGARRRPEAALFAIPRTDVHPLSAGRHARHRAGRSGAATVAPCALPHRRPRHFSASVHPAQHARAAVHVVHMRLDRHPLWTASRHEDIHQPGRIAPPRRPWQHEVHAGAEVR